MSQASKIVYVGPNTDRTMGSSAIALLHPTEDTPVMTADQ